MNNVRRDTTQNPERHTHRRRCSAPNRTQQPENRQIYVESIKQKIAITGIHIHLVEKLEEEKKASRKVNGDDRHSFR